MSTKDQYGAEQIQVLEGLEPVRKRPGMYIGSTGPKGLHHLVYEVLDNSIDEALAGRCDKIQITLHKDCVVSVVDNGHGIPVDIHPQFGIPALELVMTKLHAGGKFGGTATRFPGGCTESVFPSSMPFRSGLRWKSIPEARFITNALNGARRLQSLR